MEGPDSHRVLAGIYLRSALVLILLRTARPMSPAEMAGTLRARGWVLRGRPTKTISDALRTELRRGRVVAVGRGQYRAGYVAKVTERRMRTRLARLAAGELRPGTGQRPSRSNVAPEECAAQGQAG